MSGKPLLHDDYFARLSDALKQQGLMRPTLVIDEARLAENTATMLSHLPQGMGCRLVVKSLPSLPLLQHVMQQADTKKLMIFDLSSLPAIVTAIPDADILLGKPMPAALAAQFLDADVQWLIDTPERLKEYAALAEVRGLKLRINIEIDVGLHRGGVSEPAELKAMLDIIDAHPQLTFSGLMGYDAHVAKVPGFMQGRSFKKSQAIYKAMRTVAEERYPGRALTFNTGGSPTYQLYKDLSAGTEVSVGSGLVKPLDFDLATLKDHKATCFIATPVLKVGQKTKIPGLEALSGLTAAFNPRSAKTFFIFGGNWQAKAVSPAGLQQNKLYGRSSNEEMLNGSRKLNLNVDDLVFLRPTQSEAVFLQFGDIAVYKDGKISQFWPASARSRKKSNRH